MKIEWLGHDGMRIRTQDVVIYIDPYQIEGGDGADIMLLTHGHFDHCSPEDISKVLKADTTVISAVGCAPPKKGEEMRAGDVKEVKGITIEAVPAYNVDKKFHPKSDGGLGFVVTADGQRIYHAGDTDLIDEMDHINCDIALLPVSGTYVMSADEAAEAARRIGPKLAIPMHYGSGVVGTEADAVKFAELLEGSGIEVEIKSRTAQ
jgi:L-ascorbate metabolism protein UlaG (beta-lactamase superfamily)